MYWVPTMWWALGPGMHWQTKEWYLCLPESYRLVVGGRAKKHFLGDCCDRDCPCNRAGGKDLKEGSTRPWDSCTDGEVQWPPSFKSSSKGWLRANQGKRWLKNNPSRETDRNLMSWMWDREVRGKHWFPACANREKVMPFTEVPDAQKRANILLTYFTKGRRLWVQFGCVNFELTLRCPREDIH